MNQSKGETGTETENLSAGFGVGERHVNLIRGGGHIKKVREVRRESGLWENAQSRKIHKLKCLLLSVRDLTVDLLDAECSST